MVPSPKQFEEIILKSLLSQSVRVLSTNTGVCTACDDQDSCTRACPDIVVIHKNNKRVVIDVKRYTNSAAVSKKDAIKIIRDMRQTGSQVGIFVTFDSATYLSMPAVDVIEKSKKFVHVVPFEETLDWNLELDRAFDAFKRGLSF
eukprot:gb/GECH01004672.1/.p1 GENE.gb/GECH01004672.1/~~gb/GECH01004672.1/.p1  ORF type:complete len:145 (+),score=44.90 gb/GECH01004672.1/:1-435(+)